MRSLSIALPAFNEEANIAETALAAVEAGNAVCASPVDVIVVDDGSRDRTSEVVRNLHPQVRLYRHEANQGYGAAVHSGLKLGTERSEWVFFTDGDGQFDLSEIEKLAQFAETHDVIIGIRQPRRDPWMRKVNAAGWNFLVTTLFGQTATDIDCAFKLMKSSAIRPVLDKIESRGATFSAELLIRARLNRCTMMEVPVFGHRPRKAGSPTGAKPAVIVRAATELLQLRMKGLD